MLCRYAEAGSLHKKPRLTAKQRDSEKAPLDKARPPASAYANRLIELGLSHTFGSAV